MPIFGMNKTGACFRSVGDPLEAFDRILDRAGEALRLGFNAYSCHTLDSVKEKMNLRNAAELQHFAIKWIREREFC